MDLPKLGEEEGAELVACPQAGPPPTAVAKQVVQQVDYTTLVAACQELRQGGWIPAKIEQVKVVSC